MNKESKKQSSNLHALILSVIIAVVLWIVIGVIQDPDVTETITNLPIEYTGTSALSDKGLIVAPVSDKADIAVKIRGKRRDLISSQGNVGVVIDVSEISEEGKYTLDGTIVSTINRINIERERANTIPVTIEKLVTKEFPITVVQNNVPKGVLIETKLSETKIKVSGAQSEVDTLDGVIAELDASGMVQNSQTELTLRPKLKGTVSVPRNTTLSLSIGKVTAKNTLYTKKTLPVKMKLSQKLISDYWLDTKASICAISTAEIGVLPECTADCVYLNINSSGSEEGEYMLLSAEGMYIPEKNASVYAKPVLVPKQKRHMDINLSAINVPEGLTPEFHPTLTGILVSAPEDVLNEGHITGVLDLTGLTAGVHQVTVKIPDERVTVDEEISVEVKLE